MKLVFRLHGVGFALPLHDLIEVGEGLAALCAEEREVPPPAIAAILHRGTPLPVYDLSAWLGMAAEGSSPPANHFLVVAGADHPWVLPVDGVDGVYPDGEFELVSAPEWVFAPERRPFTTLAIRHGEPLVFCESLPFERALVMS